MRSFILSSIFVVVGVVVGIAGVVVWQRTQTPISLFSPESTIAPESATPLLAYTFEALRQTPIKPATIVLADEAIDQDEEYQAVVYHATVLGRSMSGVINLPAEVTASTSAIVMLRGWVPATQYSPGTGTKNAAQRFAKAGFVTIAPDFFGYGTSDPEPTDEWQARFEKPLAVLELLTGLQTSGIMLPNGAQFRPASVGLWGHSNGGQIALSTLVIAQQPIPTALWAPVTAPFPYSILYYSDEEADEGQSARKWISLFERTYDARQFSFTNYLDGLRGPLQLQQGTNDDAVLKWWSDEFVQKLKHENERRENVLRQDANVGQGKMAESATESGSAETMLPAAALQPINYEYFLYPGADHNLRPDWETVVARDIAFFRKEL